jgi:hypothetical protein
MPIRHVLDVGAAGVHHTTGTMRVPMRARRYGRRAADNRAERAVAATGQAIE